MEKILVATDFSAAAENALAYAVEFAKITKAKIILYHVFAPPVMPVTEVPWMVLPNSVEIKDENILVLKEELKKFVDDKKLPAEFQTEVGTPVDKIMEFAEKEKPDLIIMGMKRAGAVKEFLIGSVATSVLKRSKVPVLLIPEAYIFKKPEKIIFACDYDIKNTVILSPLKHFVNLFAAQLLVLHVSDRLAMVDSNKSIAVNKLEVALKNTVRSFHFLEDDDLIHGLKKFVEDNNADMVVTIAHKHNLIESVFRRDHNKKIAFHISVPLLSIPDNHKDVSAYFV